MYVRMARLARPRKENAKPWQVFTRILMHAQCCQETSSMTKKLSCVVCTRRDRFAFWTDAWIKHCASAIFVLNWFQNDDLEMIRNCLRCGFRVWSEGTDAVGYYKCEAITRSFSLKTPISFSTEVCKTFQGAKPSRIQGLEQTNQPPPPQTLVCLIVSSRKQKGPSRSLAFTAQHFASALSSN